MTFKVGIAVMTVGENLNHTKNLPKGSVGIVMGRTAGYSVYFPNKPSHEDMHYYGSKKCWYLREEDIRPIEEVLLD